MLLISAGIGATPVLAMLHALAEERSDREIWWLHGARSGHEHCFAAEVRLFSPSLPNARTHVYYSRPGRNDLQGRDFDGAGRLTAIRARRARAAPRRAGIRVRADAFHGGDRRRFGGIGIEASRIHTEPFGPAPGSDAGHRSNTRRGRPTRLPANPERARRSSSPAATSRSPGARTTPACWNSPRHATYPSAGRVAPASARTARRPSSPATSTTTPTPWNPLPREACSSAAHGRTATSCSICEQQARVRAARDPLPPPAPCTGRISATVQGLRRTTIEGEQWTTQRWPKKMYA